MNILPFGYPGVVSSNIVAFSLFFKPLIGQHVPTQRGFIATPWFGFRLTSPDSLHMWMDVDEMILKMRF